MSRTLNLTWDSVDWRLVTNRVLRIQRRIYKAQTSEARIRVHWLQKHLINSLDAKLLAVQTVTSLDTFHKSSGLDKVKVLDKMTMAKKLSLNGKAYPIKRHFGEREKRRVLGIPTIQDRAKQALAKLALEPEWEAKFEPNSYGFRPGRSAHDAIEAIFLSLKDNRRFWVFDADIRECLDKIDHFSLLSKLETFPQMESQVDSWLRAGIIEEYSKIPNKKEKGEIISTLLSNIALHGLEEHLKEYVGHLSFKPFLKKGPSFDTCHLTSLPLKKKESATVRSPLLHLTSLPLLTHGAKGCDVKRRLKMSAVRCSRGMITPYSKGVSSYTAFHLPYPYTAFSGVSPFLPYRGMVNRSLSLNAFHNPDFFEVKGYGKRLKTKIFGIKGSGVLPSLPSLPQRGLTPPAGGVRDLTPPAGGVRGLTPPAGGVRGLTPPAGLHPDITDIFPFLPPEGGTVITKGDVSDDPEGEDVKRRCSGDPLPQRGWAGLKPKDRLFTSAPSYPLKGVRSSPKVMSVMSGCKAGGQGSDVKKRSTNEGIRSVSRSLPEGDPQARINSLTIVRYAEKFVVIHPLREILDLCYDETRTWLSKIGLKISKDNFSVKDCQESFSFLGFQIIRIWKEKQYRVKIVPSKKSRKRFLDNVNHIIKSNRSSSSYQLISKLRPVVIGWGNEFRFCECTDTFKTLNFLLFQALRHWAFRRHPKEARSVVKEKYWPSGRTYYYDETKHQDQWVFCGKTLTKGLCVENHLPHMSWIYKKKFVKIQGRKSPFDSDHSYWAVRNSKYSAFPLQVKKLYKEQKGFCNICKKHFDTFSKLEVNHILPRALGGKDVYSNLQLLDKDCHLNKTNADMLFIAEQRKNLVSPKL